MSGDPNKSGGTALFDVVVVGGGIVGLAIGHALSIRSRGLAVGVVEKEARIATHQTGRNSGVVHSGLYYRPGSAKARTCVAGAARLRAFCAENDVRTREVGKIVVATSQAELPRLDELERRGRANGVPGLRRVDAAELREIEPHAAGLAALHVPHAAIVDYATVATALASRIRAAGGSVETSVEVHGFGREAGFHVLRTSAGDVRSRVLITAAGLQSDRVARAATGARGDVRIVPFRGEYHVLRPAREHLVRGLVYPVPDPRFPFLGAHFTRMIDGGVECGPNAVLAFRREGYRRTAFSALDTWQTLTWPGAWRLAARHWRTGLGEFRRSFSTRAFATALRRLIPDIRDDDLERGECGVRAQAVQRDGTLVDDFLIRDDEHAMHIVNAPSPAATASLAIADEVVQRAIERRLVRE